MDNKKDPFEILSWVLCGIATLLLVSEIIYHVFVK